MHRPVARWSGPAVALLVALALALVGAVGPALVPAVVGGLAAVLVDAAFHRGLVVAVPRQVDVLRAALQLRLLLAQLLVLAFVLRDRELSASAERVVVLGVVLTALLRMLLLGLQIADDRLRRDRPELRGLAVDLPAVPPRPALLGERGTVVVVLAGGLLPLGLLWRLATGSASLEAPASLVAALVCAIVLAVVTPPVSRLIRLPGRQALLRRLRAAVLETEPVVIFYFAGGRRTIFCVSTWLATIEALGVPALVMLRDPAALHALPATRLPVVCLPGDSHVLAFDLPTAGVALFASNQFENLRLVKTGRLRTAFIGHGDSDKAASANPVSKVYDEVWVAGEAGRQRLVTAGIGIRSEDVRVVGRPQVAGIVAARPRDARTQLTVLYAPTWEGYDDAAQESSVQRSGLAVVTALLGAQDVRVVFRPHPRTGSLRAGAGRAVDEIVALLGSAGAPHEWWIGPGVDIVALFNEADVLVTDVSSVISDFLASGKPLVVMDNESLPAEEFRRRNPSTQGAYLATAGGAGLLEALEDARTVDSLAARRRATRVDLLGPPVDDPYASFRRAVLDLAARPAGPG